MDSFHNLTNITNCDGTKICSEDKLLYFGFAGVFTAAFDSGIEWLIVKESLIMQIVAVLSRIHNVGVAVLV